MGLEFLFTALGKAPPPPIPPPSITPSSESTSAPLTMAMQSAPMTPPSPSPQSHASPQINADTPMPCQAVALPKLEAQPWVRRLAGALGRHTVGIARVDLRRPTAPPARQYVEGNILFFHRQGRGQGPWEGQEAGGGRGSRQRGSRRGRGPKPSDTSNPFAPLPSSSAVLQREDRPSGEATPSTGARIKVTRNVHLLKDKGPLGHPLVDLGLGLSIEMDGGSVTPIARIKVSAKIPLSTSGLGLKLLYELPLDNISRPWSPPSRLMVRLETAVGSGFHISPTGIEVDERRVHFGSNLSLRAAAGLNFPRSLPIDWDQEESSFKFKIHRLSIRSLW